MLTYAKPFISLKTLVEVKFQYEDDAKKKCQCPACLKTLSNSSKFSGKD